MATRIITKNGSGAPLASDLQQGELAVDLTNKRLYTEDSLGAVQEVGVNPAAEITANAGIALPDNQKATFGASDDLQIYHNGSQNYIEDAGTGNLNFKSNGNNFNFLDGSDNVVMQIDIDSETTLYHNTSAKLATTATGIDVTGTVTADALTVDGNAIINDTIPQLQLMESDTTDLNSVIKTTAGQFRIQTINDAANSTTNRFIIDHATGDLSLYEDTGSTAKFFWDASAESLGIGTSSPSGLLHVASTGAANIKIEDTDNGFAATELNVENGGRDFKITTPQDTIFVQGSTEAMRILDSGNVGIGTSSPSKKFVISDGGAMGVEISPDDSGNGYSRIINYDRTTNQYEPLRIEGEILQFSTGTTATEKVRIDSSDNLLVGRTSTTTSNIGVTIPASGAIQATANFNALGLNRLSGDGDIAVFQKSGATVGSIGTVNGDLLVGTGDTGLRFHDGDNRIYPIDTSGGSKVDATIDLGDPTGRFKDLYLSGGVYLGGTGAANKLDYYEEGTFTPVIQGSTTAGVAVYSGQSGTYTKVGNLVTIQANVTVTSWTTDPAGNIRLGGLPFSGKSGVVGPGSLMASNFGFSVGGSDSITATVYMAGGTDNLRIYIVRDNETWLQQSISGEAMEFIYSISYTVA